MVNRARRKRCQTPSGTDTIYRSIVLACDDNNNVVRLKLLIEVREVSVGYAVAGGGIFREYPIECLQVGCVQGYIGRGGILLHVGDPARARNRHDVITLGEDPGQGDLSRRAALRGGDLFHGRQQRLIAREILFSEPWEAFAPVLVT